MREKLFELLKQCEKECEETCCENCKYDTDLDCGNRHIADFLVANGVTLSEPTKEDTKGTARPNFEAEYARAMEELEKAKYEIDYLRDELRNAKQALSWHEAMRQTIEVIFGRKFDNG